MKRMIAVLCLIGVLMTGCGNTAPEDNTTIVGVWEHSVNAAAVLTDTLVDEQVAYFMQLDEAELYLTVTFGEDGSYTSVLNEEKSKVGLNAFVDAWYEATKEFYAALLEQNESTATVEEMLQDYKDLYGKSLHEMLEEQIEEANFPEKFKTQGTYRVEGEKLYRSEDETIYEMFLLENGALYILSSSDPNLSEAEAAGYPYKFERVQ